MKDATGGYVTDLCYWSLETNVDAVTDGARELFLALLNPIALKIALRLLQIFYYDFEFRTILSKNYE